MSSRTCHAYLQRHDVAFVPLSHRDAPDVEQPIRLRGPVAGVSFAIPWGQDDDVDRAAIWDCRLAAAMIPAARWLAAHEVRTVHYVSVLRRGAIVRSSGPDHPPMRRPSQHASGLAIDILAFDIGPLEGWSSTTSTEPRADVEDHYPKGTLETCTQPRTLLGPTMDRDGPEPAALLTEFVCFVHTGGLFHTILTPDYDHAHRNHLHLDLKAGQASPADPFTSFAQP